MTITTENQCISLPPAPSDSSLYLKTTYPNYDATAGPPFGRPATTHQHQQKIRFLAVHHQPRHHLQRGARGRQQRRERCRGQRRRGGDDAVDGVSLLVFHGGGPLGTYAGQRAEAAEDGEAVPASRALARAAADAREGRRLVRTRWFNLLPSHALLQFKSWFFFLVVDLRLFLVLSVSHGDLLVRPLSACAALRPSMRFSRRRGVASLVCRVMCRLRLRLLGCTLLALSPCSLSLSLSLSLL